MRGWHRKPDTSDDDIILSTEYGPITVKELFRMHQTRELSIQNKFFKVLVDAEDYIRLSAFTWYAGGVSGKQIRRFDGNIIKTLQSEIFGNDYYYDHIDRNPLNFQKNNLRIATHSQNGMNKSKNSKIKASSKYKGVSWCKRDKVWRAHIKLNGRGKALGSFKTEIEAAEAYNEAAEFFFKNFAVLNVIERVSVL